ncbi:MAG: hypothetical protein WB919_00065 [Candidatus Sulfotelmatobacter sp.]
MSPFRLLPFSLLLAVGVTSAAAQSAPEKTPAVAQSTESALVEVGAGLYQPRLNQFGLPHNFISRPDVQADDTLCYSMRSYKVARDSSDSDSTHPAGYSTCQPAARFRTYSIKQPVPAGQP